MIPVEAPTKLEDKIKELEKTAAALEKDHGKGSIMRMGARTIVPIQTIPTGVWGLDNIAIGAGGVPRGRITEVYGPEAGGKTTLSLQVVANAQKLGGTAAFIDAEHALSPVYATALGVDVDNMFLSQPDCGEQALEIAEQLIQSRALDVLVIDSVAALVPRAELEGEMGDSHVGLQARLMSQALRKLTGVVQKTNTAVIFINQIREKIGVMFGNPETTTGGRALKFYASLRLDIRRIGQIKDGEQIIGGRTKIKVVKNKLATPFKEHEVNIVYGQGFDADMDIAECAIKADIFEKSGAWLTFNGERWQGKAQLADAIKASDKLRLALIEALQS